jgi:hypothetical protein
VSQRSSASKSDNNDRKVCRRHVDELGDFPSQPVPDRLEEVQDRGMEFHYAWLLILIALVAWRESKDSQFLSTTNKPCLAARYTNLWHTAHKERQLDNNIHFYIYKEAIREIIQRTPCIPPQVVEAYKLVA